LLCSFHSYLIFPLAAWVSYIWGDFTLHAIFLVPVVVLSSSSSK
jgi:hypothetical protein